jgi:outer membrane protein TolC
MQNKLNLMTGLLLQPLLFAGAWSGLMISVPALCQTSNITSAVDTTLSARVPLSHTGMHKQEDRYSHTITMDQAVQIAIDNNLHVKAAIAQAGIVIGELRDDAQTHNPLIESAFERNHDGKNAVTITAKQDIMSLIFAGIKIRALASGKNEAILKASSEIYTLIGEVKRAFVRVSALHKVVDLDAAEMSAARAAASMAERQLSAGNINEIDNLQYRTAWHRMMLEYQQTVTELQVSMAGLRLTIGLAENDTALKIDIVAEPPLLTLGVDQLVAAAFENRLDLVALESGNDKLQIQRKAIRAESFGSLEAGVGVNYESGEFARPYPVVGVRLPLWNQSQGKRMGVNSALEKAEYEIGALKREIPVVVRNAVHEYQQKRTAMSLLDTMAIEQTSIVDLAQKHYNVMTMGVFDLLLAKQREIATKRELVRAEFDAWIAYVNLEQAVGTTLRTNQK